MPSENTNPGDKLSLRRRVLFTSVLLLLILTLTAALAEISLRVYQRVNPTYILPDMGYNRFRGQPFSQDWNFKLNSLGFKDTEFEKTKPEGVQRIVAIGDSFAFGVVPYEFSYLTLLERSLNGDGKSYQVYNMGIVGIDVIGYHALLETEALEYAPDMILCFLFNGNDYPPVQPPPKYYTLAFLKFFFRILPAYSDIISHPGTNYVDDGPTMKRSDYLEVVREWSRKYITDNEVFPNQVNQAVRYIDRMKKLCDDRGIEFRLVLIPDELQIDPTLQHEVTAQFESYAPADFDFVRPNALIRPQLEKLGVTYLDLLEIYRRCSQKQRLYRRQDVHWNLAGNRLATRVLEDWIRGVSLEGRAYCEAPESEERTSS